MISDEHEEDLAVSNFRRKFKLESINPANYNRPTTIFWWLLLLTNFLFLGAAAYWTLSFSATQFGILFIALVISSLASQHQLTIPRTKITLTAKEVVVFWGILWLGIAGGVLLAAAVSAVQVFSLPENKWKDERQRLLGGFVDTIAAFAAGSVFFLILKFFSGFEGSTVVEHSLAFGWLAAATAAMAIVHYLFSALPPSIFFYLANRSSIIDFWRETFVSSAAKYCFAAVAALLFNYCLLYTSPSPRDS